MNRPPFYDRFMEKVAKDPATGCWNWTAAVFRQGGYGHFTIQNRSYRAHRLSLEMSTGQAIPAGMVVCHSCDNPRCVNPDHLWLGTQLQNVRDAIGKDRMRFPKGKRGSKNNRAKLTEHDVRNIRASSESKKKLAKRFGTTPQNIAFILRRATWTHI